MNAPFSPNITDRELRWLRHTAIHGPQSSEFLLELCAYTHSCRDTSLRTLKKLRDRQYLRLPTQQAQIAKADFNPNVYDLTRRSEMHLKGLGDTETVRPTGHWWHAFLTASISSTIAIECERRSYRYIPCHEILNRNNAALAVPIGQRKLIPDQLFAIDYGGRFRSFALEVDRGTEPYRSTAARKTLASMIQTYERLSAENALRRHYSLKSPLILLFAFTSPERAAKCLELLGATSNHFNAIATVTIVPTGFCRFASLRPALGQPWTRAQHPKFDLFQ